MLAGCACNVKSSSTPTATRPGTCSPIPTSSRPGSARRSALDLRPGGAAAYVEPDGTVRHAVIEQVREGERLSFVWWDRRRGRDEPRRVRARHRSSAAPRSPSPRRARIGRGRQRSAPSRRDVGRPPVRPRAPLHHAPVRPGVSSSADHVFAALGDPTRRAVLALVGRRGPLTATELAGTSAGQPPGGDEASRPARARPDSSRARRTGEPCAIVLRAEPLDDAAALDGAGRVRVGPPPRSPVGPGDGGQTRDSDAAEMRSDVRALMVVVRKIGRGLRLAVWCWSSRRSCAPWWCSRR